jgi:rubrerythrin
MPEGGRPFNDNEEREGYMSDQSMKNLKEAFAGESQANRRYTAFSQKASDDGFSNVARMFRAIAESETIHAINHLKALGQVKSTVENIEEAWKGEKDEYTSMYPMFMDQAKRDSNSDALSSFFWANEAEKVHGDFYERALKAVQSGQDVQVGELYICLKCGFTVESDVPDKCPVCGAGKEMFQEIK